MIPAENPGSIPDDIRNVLVRTTTHLFITKGFDRTTTSELNRAHGWSKGRLFQYVGSKDDLMSSLFDFFVGRDPWEIKAYAGYGECL